MPRIDIRFTALMGAALLTLVSMNALVTVPPAQLAAIAAPELA